MWGGGRTSWPASGSTVTGPKWSKNRKGPTAWRCTAGSRRRTVKPPPRSLAWPDRRREAFMTALPSLQRKRQGQKGDSWGGSLRAGQQRRQPTSFSGSAAQLGSHLCHTLAKLLAGFQVAREHLGGRGVRWRLRHGATEGADPVHIVARGGLGVGGHHAVAHPQTAVLHGQVEHVVQRDLLVAIGAGAVGKACEQLVLPGLAEPGLGRGVGKLLELPAGAGHVRGPAKDDGAGSGQRFPAAFGQVALGIDGDQLGASALCHGLRQALCVTVTRVVNNCDVCHEKTPVETRGTRKARTAEERIECWKTQPCGQQAF